jgi:hypothetical protein
MNTARVTQEPTISTDPDTLDPLLDQLISWGKRTSVEPPAASFTHREPKMKVIRESTWNDPVRDYFEIPLVQLIESDKLGYEFNVAIGVYAIVVVRPDHLFFITRP